MEFKIFIEHCADKDVYHSGYEPLFYFLFHNQLVVYTAMFSIICTVVPFLKYFDWHRAFIDRFVNALNW
jgi:hypothetical protein